MAPRDELDRTSWLTPVRGHLEKWLRLWFRPVLFSVSQHVVRCARDGPLRRTLRDAPLPADGRDSPSTPSRRGVPSFANRWDRPVPGGRINDVALFDVSGCSVFRKNRWRQGEQGGKHESDYDSVLLWFFHLSATNDSMSCIHCVGCLQGSFY
jgi:hypothetical protein